MGVAGGVEATLLDYCEAVDEADVGRFASLFTEDAVLVEHREVTGRAAIEEYVGRLFGTLRATSHHLSNVRVADNGDGTATASSYIYAWHELADGTHFEMWGRYSDKLRDEGDRWRFTHRTVMLAGWAGIEGLPERFHRVPRA